MGDGGVQGEGGENLTSSLRASCMLLSWEVIFLPVMLAGAGSPRLVTSRDTSSPRDFDALALLRDPEQAIITTIASLLNT